MNKGIVRQWLFIIALLVAVGFLGVVYGMAAHKLKLWPFLQFRDANMAAKAWYQKVRLPDLYGPPRYFKISKQSGIYRYNKEKAYNGFTLFSSTYRQKAFLISMEGQIVHEWHLPFSTVWTEPPPHIRSLLPDKAISWRNVHLYPNGDLLAIYTVFGDTPWGYGLVKMDKDSKMIWKYAGRVHHDVDVGSDGKVYVLTHKFVTEKIPGIKRLPPLIEDGIVVLSPDGQELKSVSISDVFRDSEFSSILRLPSEAGDIAGELWHANTVEVLDDKMAEQFPFLEKGQILISLRNIDTIAVVDLEKEQAVWVLRGPWHRQHDPDFLSNGNMLIFDNYGHYHNKGGWSRVIEFNPITMEIVWQYTGNETDIFYSSLRGSVERLPNGNTLITSSHQGRIFEVTQANEIVWEFISPLRAPDDDQYVASLHWGQRFHPDFLNFEFSNNLKQD
ncbi:MAG: hypothetical protein DRQ49_17220 [Gammaproteobacteria bacterium]|nr:MAG: hypothetical protein DRQ49_17220 [Gammaproteobacteria bacterium]RKZ74609.1 MAG: hypothetical protein DRQ57_10490 [Gammaproteobacteria bacterium]